MKKNKFLCVIDGQIQCDSFTPSTLYVVEAETLEMATEIIDKEADRLVEKGDYYGAIGRAVIQIENLNELSKSNDIIKEIHE